MSNTKGQLKDPANSPEKPDGSKYEDTVLALAAEMAIQQYEKNFYAVQLPPPMPRTKFDPNHPIAQKAILSIMEKYIPAARIAVKHLAEAFKDGYNAGKYPVDPSETVDGWITELGLIPSPDQPEGTGK